MFLIALAIFGWAFVACAIFAFVYRWLLRRPHSHLRTLSLWILRIPHIIAVPGFLFSLLFSGLTDDATGIWLMVGTFGPIVLGLYLLPALCAASREHSQLGGILILNIIGTPLFFVGWLVALIWAFSNPRFDAQPLAAQSPRDHVSELERVVALHRAGALNDAEFAQAKEKLLRNEQSEVA